MDDRADEELTADELHQRVFGEPPRWKHAYIAMLTAIRKAPVSDDKMDSLEAQLKKLCRDAGWEEG